MIEENDVDSVELIIVSHGRAKWYMESDKGVFICHV